jgi:hypothetical protein
MSGLGLARRIVCAAALPLLLVSSTPSLAHAERLTPVVSAMSNQPPKSKIQSRREKRVRTPKLALSKLRWRRNEDGRFSLGVAYRVETALIFRSPDARSVLDLEDASTAAWTRRNERSDCARDPACSPYLLRQMLMVTDSVTRAIESVRLVRSIGSIQLVAGFLFTKDGEPVPTPSNSDFTLRLNPTLERGGYVLSARMFL